MPGNFYDYYGYVIYFGRKYKCWICKWQDYLHIPMGGRNEKQDITCLADRSFDYGRMQWDYLYGNYDSTHASNDPDSANP
jgi:hypothetical protein